MKPIATVLGVVIFAGLSASCQSSVSRRCVEALCFETLGDAEIISAAHRHTIRTHGSSGWFDIQVVSPLLGPPGTADRAIEMLRQRYQLMGSRVIGIDSAEIGGSQLQGIEIEITRRSGTYRRSVFVVKRQQQWLAMDITARVEAFDAARESWRGALRQAQWGTPTM